MVTTAGTAQSQVPAEPVKSATDLDRGLSSSTEHKSYLAQQYRPPLSGGSSYFDKYNPANPAPAGNSPRLKGDPQQEYLRRSERLANRSPESVVKGLDEDLKMFEALVPKGVDKDTNLAAKAVMEGIENAARDGTYRGQVFNDAWPFISADANLMRRLQTCYEYYHKDHANSRSFDQWIEQVKSTAAQDKAAYLIQNSKVDLSPVTRAYLLDSLNAQDKAKGSSEFVYRLLEEGKQMSGQEFKELISLASVAGFNKDALPKPLQAAIEVLDREDDRSPAVYGKVLSALLNESNSDLDHSRVIRALLLGASPEQQRITLYGFNSAEGKDSLNKPESALNHLNERLKSLGLDSVAQEASTLLRSENVVQANAANLAKLFAQKDPASRALALVSLVSSGSPTVLLEFVAKASLGQNATASQYIESLSDDPLLQTCLKDMNDGLKLRVNILEWAIAVKSESTFKTIINSTPAALAKDLDLEHLKVIPQDKHSKIIGSNGYIDYAKLLLDRGYTQEEADRFAK